MNLEEAEIRALPAPPPRRPSLAFWKLCRLRVRVELADLIHGRPLVLIFSVFGYLITGLMTAAFTLLWFVLLRLSPAFGEAQFLLLTQGLLSLAIFFALPTAAVLLIQELFLAKDLPFLLPLPAPLRSLLALKIIAAAMPGIAMYAVIYLPLMAAAGEANAFQLPYYLLMLLPPVALFLAVALLCAPLVLAAVRFIPPQVLLGGLMVGLLTLLGISFLSAPQPSFALSELLAPGQFNSILDFGAFSNSAFSPLSWAAVGLLDFGRGAWLKGAAGLAPLLLLCAALFAFVPPRLERWFLDVQIQKSAGRAKHKPTAFLRRPAAALGRFLARLTAPIPPVIRAILFKDLRFFTRDWQYLTILMTPLLIVGTTLVSLLRTTLAAPAESASAASSVELPSQVAQLLPLIRVYMPPLFSLGTSMMFGAYLVIPLISLEGRGFRFLRAAPVSPAKFLGAKFSAALIFLLPTYGLMTLLMQTLMNRGAPDWFYIVYAHLAQVLSLAGLAALYLRLGAAQAKFDWTHAGKLINNPANLLSMLAGSVWIACAILVFFGFPLLLVYLTPLPPTLCFLAGLLVGGVVVYGLMRWQLSATAAQVTRLFLGE